MGKADKATDMIHQKNRAAELEAFTAWVKVCCADKELRDAPNLKFDELAKPLRPVEVIRHARKDQGRFDQGARRCRSLHRRRCRLRRCGH